MPTVQYRPTSPGRRFQTGSDFAEITKARPEGSLTAPLRKTGGRNNLGRMTIRHRGGGHKRLYRVIDFKRDKLGVPADRKSTRLNSSHGYISYAIFCLKKKKRHLMMKT